MDGSQRLGRSEWSERSNESRPLDGDPIAGNRAHTHRSKADFFEWVEPNQVTRSVWCERWINICGHPCSIRLVMLNHPLGPSITNQIIQASRYMYFPRCSTCIPLQNYASIPFNHIELKQATNQKLINTDRVITKERPTGQNNN